MSFCMLRGYSGYRHSQQQQLFFIVHRYSRSAIVGPILMLELRRLPHELTRVCYLDS